MFAHKLFCCWGGWGWGHHTEEERQQKKMRKQWRNKMQREGKSQNEQARSVEMWNSEGSEGGGGKARFLLEAIAVVAMRPAPAEDQQAACRWWFLSCTKAFLWHSFRVVYYLSKHLTRWLFSSFFSSSGPPSKMEVENEAHCCPGSSSGGSREYKVVMLGAGGVGKSGKFPNAGGRRDPYRGSCIDHGS